MMMMMITTVVEITKQSDECVDNMDQKVCMCMGVAKQNRIIIFAFTKNEFCSFD